MSFLAAACANRGHGLPDGREPITCRGAEKPDARRHRVPAARAPGGEVGLDLPAAPPVTARGEGYA